MKKIKKKLYAVLLLIFLLIFLISIIFLAIPSISKWYTEYKLSKINNGSVSKSSDILVENPINFAELQEINPEIYAWIRIPNTNIDYPVAQSATDDNFYLHHDIYGKYIFSGTIYSEMRNRKDFSDPNTILYGHNMTKGYMFQNLYKFQDEEFFINNKEFYVYTPDSILTYTVYAAYQYDDRHILNSFDFYDKDVFAEYIESTKNPRFMLKNIRQDVEVTTDDKIITLSTCLGNGKYYRYLVQGVLTDVQKTK